MRVIVCGGGPGGATAAHTLSREGIETVLIEKSLSRIKPCGGAIPPILVREFDIPETLIQRRVDAVAVYAPSGRAVKMEIHDGYVGMVCREAFDAFLRRRAAEAGAQTLEARVDAVDATERGASVVCTTPGGRQVTLFADAVIGADGANSLVGRRFGLNQGGLVAAAVQERFALSSETARRLNERCEIYYDSRFSPDFYGWVFPKADHVAIGTGTAMRSANIKKHLEAMKAHLGVHEAPTLREGAPIPLRPYKRWVANRVALVGDAAGLVASSSGEGIFYAMKSGQMAAQAIAAGGENLSGEALRHAYQKEFLKKFGATFRFLEVMQNAYYKNDARREAFVAICRDRGVQDMTFQSYMYKRMVRMPVLDGIRILSKNFFHMSKAMLGGYRTPHRTGEPVLLP
jgi:geranylgeranyl diphosphate/geranylgeranyl-bacteriochlorophyllide a reductase